MACNLCHSPDGHTKTCPTQIRVEWQSSGSIWETLTRTLFDLYAESEKSEIVRYGSAEDAHTFDVFVRHCKQALDDGDPYTVVQLMEALDIKEG